MKFYKSLGLLAAAAGLLMTGCGENGVSSDLDIVKEAAKTDALIVSSSGTTFSSARVNELPSNKLALNLANSMGAEARVKDDSGNIVTTFVITTVTWAITGDGAEAWKHKTAFDDKTNDYQYWAASAPTGTEKVSVTFTATITYNTASTTVAYNFLMCPKA